MSSQRVPRSLHKRLQEARRGQTESASTTESTPSLPDLKFSSDRTSLSSKTENSISSRKFIPKYIFDRHRRPKVYYFQKPTSQAPYYHPHLAHDKELTRLLEQAYRTQSDSSKRSYSPNGSHALPSIMTSRSTLPPTRREESVQRRTLLYLHHEDETLNDRVRKNWLMRLEDARRKFAMQKQKTNSPTTEKEQSVPEKSERKTSRFFRKSQFKTLPTIGTRDSKMSKSTKPSISGDVAMPPIDTEQGISENTMQRRKNLVTESQREVLPCISCESKRGTRKRRGQQTRASEKTVTKLPKLAQDTTQGISETVLEKDPDQTSSLETKDGPIKNWLRTTTSPNTEQSSSIKIRAGCGRKSKSPQSISTMSDIVFRRSKSKVHVKHESPRDSAAQLHAPRGTEENAGGTAVSKRVQPNNLPGSKVESKRKLPRATLQRKLKNKASSPSISSNGRGRLDTNPSLQSSTSLTTNTARNSQELNVGETMEKHSSTILQRMNAAKKLAEQMRHVYLGSLVAQVYTRNAKLAEAEQLTERERHLYQEEFIKRYMAKERIRELNNIMQLYVKHAINKRREEKERQVAEERVLLGIKKGSPPWKYLDCGYLRLNKENVTHLENMATRAGCPVGLHRHTTYDELDDYFRNAEEQERRAKIRARWWKLIRLALGKPPYH